MKHPCILAFTLVSLLSGCTITRESPPTHFYILPSLAPQGMTANSTRHVIGIKIVKIPGYLDRPQIVTMTTEGQVKLADLHRWAEPFTSGFSRVLTTSLSARLPDSQIVSGPTRHLEPEWILLLAVNDYQVHESECHLMASWRIVHQGKTLIWHQEDILVPLPSSDYGTIVKTMSQAIDLLAAKIVETLPGE